LDREGKTCKDCANFLGLGDWDLCCKESHEGYPFGFLCYEDTPICEKFKDKGEVNGINSTLFEKL